MPVKLGVAATDHPSSTQGSLQGIQREARSSSSAFARPLFTSPERKERTPNVSLPADIDMDVFKGPIPGRSWKQDCAKRDQYLHGYALGHRAHLISLLRNLVREMSIFKVEADLQEARRRGVGLCVDPNAMGWWHAKDDGWTGLALTSAPVSKRYAKRAALIKEEQMMEESFGFSNNLRAARSALLETHRPFECHNAPHGVEPIAKEKPKSQLRRPMSTIVQKPTNEWMVVVNGKFRGGADDNVTPKSDKVSVAQKKAKFGNNIVHRNTYANWWKKFETGNFVLSQRGRPLLATPVTPVTTKTKRSGTDRQLSKPDDAPQTPTDLKSPLAKMHFFADDQTGMVTPKNQSVVNEAQQVPDVGLDNYEDATDQNAFTDAAQQELAESLGITKKPKSQLRRPMSTIVQKPTNEWMVVVNGKFRGGADDNVTPKSDKVSVAAKEVQHQYLLGLFRQVPRNRPMLATPVTPVTTKTKRSGTDRQLSKPNDAPQTPTDLKSPLAKMHFFADDQTGMVTPQNESVVNEAQQVPDVGLDNYEDATDQNAFTDAAQQELAESLGITSQLLAEGQALMTDKNAHPQLHQ
uniref:DRBM domain-containing protein n=1 Tax=Globodera pallida TaxID=36090 RepID=A0A183CMW6_GLOPA